jgi:predicted RecA/RadA family phage recombinase
MTLRIASPSEQTKTRQFAQASAVVTAGVMVPVVISSKIYIPLDESLAAADNAYLMEGLIKDAPKATGAAWTMGQKLYWDDTAKKFTGTSSANTLCGYAAAPAASGDTTGSVDFNSNAA